MLVLLIAAGINGPVRAQYICVDITDGLRSMHVEPVEIINDNGTQILLEPLIANDNFERASGFQHICPRVVDSTLILFQYPSEIIARFHMQNVYAPLDIAFFDGKGSLIKVLLMRPYSDGIVKLYDPGEPFQFALEARQGFFSSHKISTSKSRLKIAE